MDQVVEDLGYQDDLIHHRGDRSGSSRWIVVVIVVAIFWWQMGERRDKGENVVVVVVSFLGGCASWFGGCKMMMMIGVPFHEWWCPRNEFVQGPKWLRPNRRRGLKNGRQYFIPNGVLLLLFVILRKPHYGEARRHGPTQGDGSCLSRNHPFQQEAVQKTGGW